MSFYADIAAAQADGVVHYWPMDGFLGADIIEDKVGGWNGAFVSSFTGSPELTIVSSPLGFARDITANGLQDSNKAVIGFDPSSQPTTTFYRFSLRVRVFIKSISGSHDLIFLGMSGNNDVRLYIEAGNLYLIDSTILSTPITLNSWNEIVFTGYSATNGSNGVMRRLYLNGVEVGSFVSSSFKGGAQIYDSVQPLAFGGQNGNLSYATDAIIDEVAFWNRNLSAAEISSLYSDSSPIALLDYVAPPEPVIPTLDPTINVATYSAKLTGDQDALTDLEIPISSFNARLRSARDSYLSIVVPSSEGLISEIEARPNGDIVINQALDGISTELARVNFDELRIDRESRSGTLITLSGNKQETYTQEQNWILPSIEYYSRSGAKSRVRLQANTSIKPADTVETSEATFIVDTVTLIGSVNRVYMELSE